MTMDDYGERPDIAGVAIVNSDTTSGTGMYTNGIVNGNTSVI